MEATMGKYEAGECPKGCGRAAGFEVAGVDVWMVCACGFRKLSYTVNSEGMVIAHVTPSSRAKLPRVGTRLSNCLIVVAEFGKATTRCAADKIGLPSGDMATQLTILECRGLVERLNSLRGVAGGSTWQLTKRAKELLRVE